MGYALTFLLGLGVGFVFAGLWHWSSELAKYER